MTVHPKNTFSKRKPIIAISLGVILTGFGLIKLSYYMHSADNTKDREQAQSPARTSTLNIQDHRALNPVEQNSLDGIAYDADLQPPDEAIFVSEVINLFREISPGALDKSIVRAQLMELNKRGEAGVRAIYRRLANPPTKDAEVEPRLSMIDYLNYRAKFDSKSRSALVNLIQIPINTGMSFRYKAVLFADRAEMLGGLAAVDWDAASTILANEADPVQRELMTDQAYRYLLAAGASEAYATSLVQERVPKFHHQ